jgi:hypothetical protein
MSRYPFDIRIELPSGAHREHCQSQIDLGLAAYARFYAIHKDAPSADPARRECTVRIVPGAGRYRYQAGYYNDECAFVPVVWND